MDVAFFRKIAGITPWTSWPSLAAAFLNGKLRFRRRICLRTRTGKVVLTPDPGWKEILSFWHEITTEQPYRHLSDEAHRATHLLDCGANAGAFLVSTLRRFSHLNATGFEPHPATHRLLMENLKANGLLSRTAAPHQAVGAMRETVEFTAYSGTTMAQSSRAPVKMASFVPAGVFSIEQIRLDDWLAGEHSAGRQPRCLLKIDVEGFEAEVIKGARETLRHTVAASIETHTESLTADCCSMLSDAGFIVTAIPYHEPGMAIVNGVRPAV